MAIARTAGRVAAFAALAVLLSACLKLDMDLRVSADDTVSGSVIFAMDKDLLELTGQSVEDVLGADAPVPTDAEGVSAEAYEDDRFAGQRFSFDAVPLAQFNQGEDPESLTIVREGDAFRVTGVLDLAGATGATGVPGFEDAFQGAELRIRISFPGEVADANGAIDGNTVTWEPRIGERLELQATASAIQSAGGGSNLTLILIIVGVVVVAVAAVAIVMGRRRGAQPSVPEEGVAAAPPSMPPTTEASAEAGAVAPPTTPATSEVPEPSPPTTGERPEAPEPPPPPPSQG